jgi:two-component system, OmpR family, alkaline phosphatase synthesis response regulator PhoP
MTISATQNPKILVVEDDASVRNLVYRFLNQTYQVQFAADGKTALDIFDKFNPVLVILDWNLPDTTGYQLCQEMQKRTNVLVVILSSRTDQEDRIKIMKAGADDFMCKPFYLDELAVRIEVLLRRVKTVTPRCLVFGELAIDLASKEVRLKEQTLTLTPLEFKLLNFLALHSGKALSRQQLIEKVWGWKYDAAAERVVDVHIGHIRQKMAQVDVAVPNFIKTVRGYGYTFNPSDRNIRVVSN